MKLDVNRIGSTEVRDSQPREISLTRRAPHSLSSVFLRIKCRFRMPPWMNVTTINSDSKRDPLFHLIH